MMGGGQGVVMWWSGGGLLWFAIYAVLVVVPFWRLLPRYGIPSWGALLAIFPLVALILLWIMAFRDQSEGGGA